MPSDEQSSRDEFVTCHQSVNSPQLPLKVSNSFRDSLTENSLLQTSSKLSSSNNHNKINFFAARSSSSKIEIDSDQFDTPNSSLGDLLNNNQIQREDV